MITRYFLKEFLIYLCLFLLITIVISVIGSIFDLTSIYSVYGVSVWDIFILSILKTPFIIHEVIIVLIFFVNLTILHKMISKNELIILLTSGLSIWRLILLSCIFSFFTVIISTFLILPISSYSMSKFDVLVKKIKNYNEDLIYKDDNDLFVMENIEKDYKRDDERDDEKNDKFDFLLSKRYLYQVYTINNKEKILNRVSFILLDSSKKSDNDLKARYRGFAKKGRIENGMIKLYDVLIYNLSGNEPNKSNYYEEYFIPTKLSFEVFLLLSLKITRVNFWQLVNMLDKLDNFAINNLPYKVYLYKNFFKAFFAMIIALASYFYIDLNKRSGNNGKLILYGILSIIFLFFAIEIIPRILSYSIFSPFYAYFVLLLMMGFFYIFLIINKYERE